MTTPDYSRWNRAPHVSVTHSAEGLPLFDIQGAFGTAQFSPQGAHLITFTPAGGEPMLFLSSKSHLAPGKAIRGGVPVIFPWFGPRAGHPESPMHGLVRTRPWAVDAIAIPETGPASVRCSFASSEETLTHWPHPFELELEYRLGDALEIHWLVRNTGPHPFRFEQALHPYFPVEDVSSACVRGLQGASYIDKTDNLRLKEDPASAVTFTGETDRLYLDTTADLLLEDPASKSRLVFHKTGSASSVVWNPWVAKAASLPDLADEEWRNFVCVEQVNAARNALELAPGTVHEMSVTIRREPIL